MIRRTRHRIAVALLLWSAIAWSTPVLAWGSGGHQYVGNLASALLNPSAQRQISALLGPNIDLAHAAVWPDCIRSVSKTATKTFVYKHNLYTPDACAAFGNDETERSRMEDYAKRNWTNCTYSGQRQKCNLAYHFADVNFHSHDAYHAGYFGTNEHDVVHAIEAALVVLKCPADQTCPAPNPFRIRDAREALLLLSHFVGDVHQPLHVGAIYLDANNQEGDDRAASTTGGNALLITPGNTSNNLHHEWDTILASLGTAPTPAVVADACGKLASIELLPEVWASESIAAAKTAYRGMEFTPDSSQAGDWDIHFDDRKSYTKLVDAEQSLRLEQAGIRLAASLNAIWPSDQTPHACATTPAPQ